MSDYLSERIRLKQLNPDRFDAPRIDEMEISAGENEEGEAIIVAMEGRKRKILKPTEDKSTIVYDKVRDEIFFEQKDDKPQFIYFMEFTFDNLMADQVNSIKKITANVGFIDFIDNHLVFVGQSHDAGQKINVYYSSWNREQSQYDAPELIFEAVTEGIGGDRTYDLIKPESYEDNIINVKDRDRLLVEVDTTENQSNPLQYAHVVIKVRINTKDLTSPWARSIFQDFLEQPYSQLISDENKTKVLDYLEQQVIYNKFGPNGANYEDSSFLFAYQFTENDIPDSDHFRIPSIRNIDRTWTINGVSKQVRGVPSDSLIIEPGFSETFVIVTQEEGNVFEDLIHMEDGYTGILPILWARRVMSDWLGRNQQLSTLNRQAEWSQEGIDHSKTWSDDNETITPWRFQGYNTPNMVPEYLWEPQSQWGEPGGNITEDGLQANPLEVDEDRPFPRRMWGNNTPEIDKLFHRLIGSDKYTVYYNQYSKYNIVEKTDPDFDGRTYVPTSDASIDETYESVRQYYWKYFGLEKDAKGYIDSKWFYPLWAGDDGGFGSPDPDHPDREKFMYWRVINRAIHNESYKINIYGQPQRIDNEGYVINGSESGMFNVGNRLFDINNRQDIFPDPDTEYRHYYYYKNDKLAIVTGNYHDPITVGLLQTSSVTWGQLHGLTKPFIYSYEYYNISVRGKYHDRYALPTLFGNFKFDINDYIISSQWLVNQNQIPISESDIELQGVNLANLENDRPISFTNITTQLGQGFAYNAAQLRLEIDFLNCQNLRTVSSISNTLRVKNCPSLVNLICRFIRTIDNNLEYDTDANGDIININADIASMIWVTSCNLSSTEVDKFISAVHKEASNPDPELANTGGFLRLDNFVSNPSPGRQATEAPNSPPSSDNVYQDTMQHKPGSKLDELMSLYGWTVIWAEKPYDEPQYDQGEDNYDTSYFSIKTINQIK